MCLYFYPRGNLRYAVAMHKQTQAWTFAPAAGAYAHMDFKPGFTCPNVLLFLEVACEWPLGSDLDFIVSVQWQYDKQKNWSPWLNVD